MEEYAILNSRDNPTVVMSAIAFTVLVPSLMLSVDLHL